MLLLWIDAVCIYTYLQAGNSEVAAVLPGAWEAPLIFKVTASQGQ